MAEFTLIPDFVIVEDINFDTLTSGEFSGLEQRRSKRANPLRSWSLQFIKRTQAELDTVRDFFSSKHGDAEHFTWENPIDSTEYYVRFADKKITYKFLQYNVYNFSFSFQEVFYWSTTSTTSTSSTSTTSTSTTTTT